MPSNRPRRARSRPPRTAPPRAEARDEPLAILGRHAAHGSPTAPGTPVENLTDLGNARRLVSRCGQDIRYCHALRTWLLWDGLRWRRDDTGGIYALAKDTIRAIPAEAGAGDYELKKALTEHALRSESAPRLRGMVELTKTEPGIPVRPGDFDADPLLLNTRTGTIDLRTGELGPHRREDLITKLAPVAYDSAAPYPTWEAFLDRTFAGSQTLITFIQRAVGYALTGLSTEQVLFFLHGPGANGKSTFINTILAMMGDYGRQAAPGLLTARRFDAHPTEIADIAGSRFVASVEVEEGRRLAEVLVKQLTGGDRVKARFMRQDFFEFQQTAKIFLAGNHKPLVRGVDHAIWRRILMVPFTVIIPAADQDKALPAKLLAELPGVLAWAVRGCREWQRRGLDVPAEIRTATDAYRAEMDVLGGFLADCCQQSAAAQVTAGELYSAYVAWCQRNGDEPLSQKGLAAQLRCRGFQPGRSGHGRTRTWLGIALKREPRTHADGSAP